MSKFALTSYTSPINILKIDHVVSIGVTVSDAGISANADGKKIVAAGTIIGGIGGSTLADDTKQVEAKTTQGGATGTTGAGVDAEGVLLTDVDVTYGPASGAMVIHGFIDSNKIVAPVADAKTALKSRILFID